MLLIVAVLIVTEVDSRDFHLSLDIEDGDKSWISPVIRQGSSAVVFELSSASWKGHMSLQSSAAVFRDEESMARNLGFDVQNLCLVTNRIEEYLTRATSKRAAGTHLNFELLAGSLS